jgi:hypothetical protein
MVALLRPVSTVRAIAGAVSLLTASVAALLFSASALGQGKGAADATQQADRLIDAMASRNKEPKIVCTAFNDEVPVFADNYDWPEQDRVWQAFQTVIKTKSDEMWWRLLEHAGDARYALTGDCDEFVDMTAENFSVGSLCSHIASADLGGPYLRHLPTGPEDWRILPEFHPQDEIWKHKEKWAGKPLYLMQIEVCRRAIEEMAKATGTPSWHHGDGPAHTFTAEEKARFTEEVKKEIQKLERTKQASTSTEIRLPGGVYGRFTAKRAEVARELYEKEGAREPDKKSGKKPDADSR